MDGWIPPDFFPRKNGFLVVVKKEFAKLKGTDERNTRFGKDTKPGVLSVLVHGEIHQGEVGLDHMKIRSFGDTRLRNDVFFYPVGFDFGMIFVMKIHVDNVFVFFYPFSPDVFLVQNVFTTN